MNKNSISDACLLCAMIMMVMMMMNGMRRKGGYVQVE